MYETLSDIQSAAGGDTSPEAGFSISQGDIFDNCPVLLWPDTITNVEDDTSAELVYSRVVIMTQACDLANTKTHRAVVAIVHQAQDLVDSRQLKAKYIRDNVRPGKVFGWYFLQADPAIKFPESLVDLRNLHTVPLALLRGLLDSGNHLCRLVTPWREHLAQHFANTYARIGLPVPYQTES